MELLLHQAPPFAPLLFADLAVLGGIGLLALPEDRRDSPESRP